MSIRFSIDLAFDYIFDSHTYCLSYDNFITKQTTINIYLLT